ncbi:hypothetical protein [Photobacterium nomapromontoriensis]|uniref:hypothetical protein n=1 Tax=Photobacterium nomapromontoriensis TaxID=2910237 RepID=UPI003D0C5B73
MGCSFHFETFRYNIDSNLEAMGFPSITSVYGATATVTAALKAVDSAIALKGATAPMSAISRGTTIAGGVLAAGWAGAVLGSAVMATKRATRCTIPELKEVANSVGLDGSWIDDAYRQNEQMLRANN